MSEAVLLIANESALQKEVEPPLKQAGFDVTIVTDSISAIDVALKHPPDLILADFNPEEMNSLCFFQEIRQKEHLGVIPVVLFIHPTDSGNFIQLDSAGVKAFLKKPVQAAELTKMVQEQLQSPSKDEAALELPAPPPSSTKLLSSQNEANAAMKQHTQELVEKVIRERLSEILETTVTPETIAEIIGEVAREIIPPIAEYEVIKEIKRLQPDTDETV